MNILRQSKNNVINLEGISRYHRTSSFTERVNYSDDGWTIDKKFNLDYDLDD